jgi:HK97 family phage major capsid protein
MKIIRGAIEGIHYRVVNGRAFPIVRGGDGPSPTLDELRASIDYLDACLTDIHARGSGRALDDAEQVQFDEGVAERARLLAEHTALAARHAQIADLARNRPAAVVSGDGPASAPNVNLNRDADPFDMSEVRWNAPASVVRGKALAAIEKVGHISDADREKAESVLRSIDTYDGAVAKHIIATGSDTYRQAFQKIASGDVALLSNDERQSVEVARAASLTSASGGYAVPFTLDPTIIDTGSHTVNPFRQISRVVQTTTNVWHGVSSAGVTASWDAEAAEVSDDTPTLAQPAVTCYKGQAFVPFSVEIGGDWAAIESDLRGMIQRGKDDLEGAAFATGTGSAQPKGVVTAIAAVSGSKVAPATGETFAVADVYATEAALAARYRSRASWVANKAWYSKIRQFDTAGGSSFWANLGGGQPPELMMYPAYESSDMDGALPDAAVDAQNYALLLGDFSNYLIADRVGMSIELVPHLFHTSNNRPSGQRGFLAWWRVGADVVNTDAFRLLSIPTAA